MKSWKIDKDKEGNYFVVTPEGIEIQPYSNWITFWPGYKSASPLGFWQVSACLKFIGDNAFYMAVGRMVNL